MMDVLAEPDCFGIPRSVTERSNMTREMMYQASQLGIRLRPELIRLTAVNFRFDNEGNPTPIKWVWAIYRDAEEAASAIWYDKGMGPDAWMGAAIQGVWDPENAPRSCGYCAAELTHKDPCCWRCGGR